MDGFVFPTLHGTSRTNGQLNGLDHRWRNDQTSINIAYSHLISVTASGTSTIGIEDKDLTSVSIFPNPSNGVVNVELDATADATVTVVDVLTK